MHRCYECIISYILPSLLKWRNNAALRCQYRVFTIQFYESPKIFKCSKCVNVSYSLNDILIFNDNITGNIKHIHVPCHSYQYSCTVFVCSFHQTVVYGKIKVSTNLKKNKDNFKRNNIMCFLFWNTFLEWNFTFSIGFALSAP